MIRAIEGLVFPLLLKPNVAGSGAGIVRYDSPRPLAADAAAERIPPSLDGTWLLQRQLFVHDINALSNFVADGQKLLEFDPTARLVDRLLARAGSAA